MSLAGLGFKHSLSLPRRAAPSRQWARALLLTAAIFCSNVTAQNAELQSLRAKIDALQAKIASTEELRSEIREELRESERAISTTNRSMRELAKDREQARKALLALNARRAAAEVERERHERSLGTLLAALHKQGEIGFLRLLFSGNDPHQASRDLHYLSYIANAQASAIASAREELAKILRIEAEQAEQARAVARIEASEKASRTALLEQRAARRAVIDRVSAQIRAQQVEVRSMQRDEARLSKLVAEIAKVIADTPRTPREARPGGAVADGRSFPGLKGQLRLPARGTVALGFGTARPEGGPTLKGVFIRAIAGDEVRAVAGGRVVFAEWMRGFGNLVILDHGEDYLSIYGNNESLLKSVGDPVRSGDPIATVGTSGGGQETGLYFEMRYQGKPFDPAHWLSRR